MGSELVSRKNLASRAGMHFGGQRDLYETMGYPRALAVQDFIDSYLRQDIAGRIIDAFPDATWREQPDVEGSPEVAESWRTLEEKHNLLRSLHRLDRLTGMGHYGVLLLGLDGGEEMSQPAERKDYELLYVQPHSERTAQVSRWDADPRSARFGRPEMYNITSGVNWTGAGAGQRMFSVHHSRVIHVAERALEDDSIGTPRLERVFNRLMDLDKLLGGGAEMYWQNVAMILAFIADADAAWDPEEREDMQNQLEEMMHGLRRQLRLRGVNPEQLAPGLQGADPSSLIDKMYDSIAGAVGIPKRILLGTERGELSSSQDENNWSARITERREQFAGPVILDAFFKAGQRLGFMAQGDYKIVWPESDTLGEAGRADVALKKAQALQAYLSAMGAETVVPPPLFRQWLGEAPRIDEDGEEALPEDDIAVIEQFALHRARRNV